jgi:hypothetical protein
MAFSPRAAFRVSPAALALILCGACGAFEPQDSEFPDAGPNGPDSLYAGIGHGIPFGEAGLAPDQFHPPMTGAIVSVSRSTVGSVLKAARAGRLRLVLNLAGSGTHYRTPDGTFNLEVWKSRIDTYRDVDFSPYVTEGLILAHFLMDEPGAAQTWGGREVGRADIEEMARYSKSIWPTLPTAVRAPPGWLRAGDTIYQSLDIAWAQWAGPFHGAGSGLTPEQFRDQNVAFAKELGLGLVFGMNYIDGGGGESGLHGTDGHPDWWQMSPEELLHVGAVLVQAPYACAFLSWRYDAGYESRPEVRSALDAVAGMAATRGGTSCWRHDSSTGVPGDSSSSPSTPAAVEARSAPALPPVDTAHRLPASAVSRPVLRPASVSARHRSR